MRADQVDDRGVPITGEGRQLQRASQRLRGEGSLGTAEPPGGLPAQRAVGDPERDVGRRRPGDRHRGRRREVGEAQPRPLRSGGPQRGRQVGLDGAADGVRGTGRGREHPGAGHLEDCLAGLREVEERLFVGGVHAQGEGEVESAIPGIGEAQSGSTAEVLEQVRVGTQRPDHGVGRQVEAALAGRLQDASTRLARGHDSAVLCAYVVGELLQRHGGGVDLVGVDQRQLQERDRRGLVQAVQLGEQPGDHGAVGAEVESTQQRGQRGTQRPQAGLQLDGRGPRDVVRPRVARG